MGQRVWDGKWTWATKLECEYTENLCQAVAERVTQLVHRDPFPTPRPKKGRKLPSRSEKLSSQRASAGRQSKYAHKANVPERKEPVWRSFLSAKRPRLEVGRVKEDVCWESNKITKGSFIHSLDQKKKGETGIEQWTTWALVAEAWTTEEFLQQSEKVALPWREQADIPDRSLQVIVDTLTKGVEAYNDKWDRNCDILLKRACSHYREKEKRAR